MTKRNNFIKEFERQLMPTMDATGQWEVAKRDHVVASWTRYNMAPLRDLTEDELAEILLRVHKSFKPDTRPQAPAPTFDPGPVTRLAVQLGWDEKTSAIPGYFPSRKDGHKCLWSVRWLTGRPGGGGFMYLDPLSLKLDPELMPEPFLACELEDYAGRGDPVAAGLLERSQAGWNAGLRGEIAAHLRRARELADEYQAVWDPPSSEVVKYRRLRPGWE